MLIDMVRLGSLILLEKFIPRMESTGFNNYSMMCLISELEGGLHKMILFGVGILTEKSLPFQKKREFS